MALMFLTLFNASHVQYIYMYSPIRLQSNVSYALLQEFMSKSTVNVML